MVGCRGRGGALLDGRARLCVRVGVFKSFWVVPWAGTRGDGRRQRGAPAGGASRGVAEWSLSKLCVFFFSFYVMKGMRVDTNGRIDKTTTCFGSKTVLTRAMYARAICMVACALAVARIFGG